MERKSGGPRACKSYPPFNASPSYSHTNMLARTRSQTQNTNPDYLSRIPDPSPSLPNRDRPLFRKTDFCFSYSYLDPRFAALYTQLEGSEDMHVSHTLDNFT